MEGVLLLLALQASSTGIQQAGSASAAHLAARQIPTLLDVLCTDDAGPLRVRQLVYAYQKLHRLYDPSSLGYHEVMSKFLSRTEDTGILNSPSTRGDRSMPLQCLARPQRDRRAFSHIATSGQSAACLDRWLVSEQLRVRVSKEPQATGQVMRPPGRQPQHHSRRHHTLWCCSMGACLSLSDD